MHACARAEAMPSSRPPHRGIHIVPNLLLLQWIAWRRRARRRRPARVSARRLVPMAVALAACGLVAAAPAAAAAVVSTIAAARRLALPLSVPAIRGAPRRLPTGIAITAIAGLVIPAGRAAATPATGLSTAVCAAEGRRVCWRRRRSIASLLLLLLLLHGLLLHGRGAIA